MKDAGIVDFTLAILTANVLRYLVISGVFFLLFYVLFKSRWAKKKIQPSFPKNQDYLREFGYSILTLLIFVATALLIFTRP